MAFNVRVFGHRGTRQIIEVNPTQYTADSIFVLYQPYEWSQVIATNGAVAVNTISVANDASIVIRVEVPDGQTIRYEVNPPNRTGGQVAAGNGSPRLSGIDIFQWGLGWTFSIVEAASFP
jgi:hypothetical protein